MYHINTFVQRIDQLRIGIELPLNHYNTFDISVHFMPPQRMKGLQQYIYIYIESETQFKIKNEWGSDT